MAQVALYWQRALFSSASRRREEHAPGVAWSAPGPDTASRSLSGLCRRESLSGRAHRRKASGSKAAQSPLAFQIPYANLTIFAPSLLLAVYKAFDEENGIEVGQSMGARGGACSSKRVQPCLRACMACVYACNHLGESQGKETPGVAV